MERIAYDATIGGENTENEITSANSNFVKLFPVKNEFTYPVRVLGIQVRFKDGLGDCLINLKDGNGNEIFTGKINLSQVGNTFTAAIARDELPVDFEIPAGNEISVYIANKAIPVLKGDVNVAFFVLRKDPNHFSSKQQTQSLPGRQPLPVRR